MKKIYLIIYITTLCWSHANAGNDKGVNIFCGTDLTYQATDHLRLYDILLYLTPGVKWNLGHEWQFAAQAGVPIVNDGYDEKYSHITIKNLTVAKQLHFNSHLHLKVSGGMFSRHRYGLDVKWMGIVNNWLAFTAQGGFVGKYSAYDVWGFDKMNTLTFLLGSKMYLQPWNTELGIYGGRYINKDYGAEGEVLRHFKYCTVSLFGQIHEKRSYILQGNRFSGGFRIVILLPHWYWEKGKVRVRPASNFRLTDIITTERTLQKMYYTDPEENEREGWFNKDEVRWGANLMDGEGGNHDEK